MGECPSCYNTSCPEVVPVTQESYTVLIDGGSVDIVVADVVPPEATKQYITIDSGGTGFKDFRCRLVDNPASPGDVTLNPPSETAA